MEAKEKVRIRARAWYKNNKERALKSMKVWRLKNAESIKNKKQEYNRKNRKRNALRARAYRENNHDKIYIQKRNWYLKNKERVFANVKSKADPEKMKARKILYQAVKRAKIKKKPCKVCKSEDVQAHHSDYAFPLKVDWLCRKHHYQRHRKISL